ncbi:MAG: PilZ domain-containing protein [Candidatus Omnitrophica bacterium]|nr:PilZ domain-containing protein [Candidatus Omnitrophota bacterium]
MYEGQERREFSRIDHASPLSFKVCKEETVSRLLEGYTANVSEAGLFCTLKQPVQMDDILWLAFDRSTLECCSGLEKRALIYQNGVIGRVVRVESVEGDAFKVGIQFITREEKNMSNIYPRIHFVLTGTGQPAEPDEDEEM